MRLTTLTLAALAALTMSAPVSAGDESPLGPVTVIASVECGAGLYSVNFVATVAEPTGGSYVVTPLYGASIGPFPDSQPFRHTVGPMTDQPSSLGTFAFYVTRPSQPYDSTRWHWLSVAAPGCNEPAVPAEDPPVPPVTPDPVTETPVVAVPPIPEPPTEPIVESVVAVEVGSPFRPTAPDGCPTIVSLL